jgi:hypothetical protein
MGGSSCIYSGVTKNWKSFLRFEEVLCLTVSDFLLPVQTTTVRSGRRLLFDAIVEWLGLL